MRQPPSANDTLNTVQISGLNPGAPVRYKGIPIGRVASIRLDPENVERIRVRTEIDPGVPIKKDAVASLESEGITTVRHLVSRSEDQLLTVRNFGETTLKEVRAKLHEIGLDLGMNVPQRSGV